MFIVRTWTWSHLHHRVSPVNVVPEVCTEHRVVVAAEAGPGLLWPRHWVWPRIPEESVSVSAHPPDTVMSPGHVGGQDSQPWQYLILSYLTNEKRDLFTNKHQGQDNLQGHGRLSRTFWTLTFCLQVNTKIHHLNHKRTFKVHMYMCIKSYTWQPTYGASV